MSQKKINPNCPCTSNCVRHGNCVECREYHSKASSPTACLKNLEKKDDKN